MIRRGARSGRRALPPGRLEAGGRLDRDQRVDRPFLFEADDLDDPELRVAVAAERRTGLDPHTGQQLDRPEVLAGSAEHSVLRMWQVSTNTRSYERRASRKYLRLLR
jgi:hypothetical protein